MVTMVTVVVVVLCGGVVAADVLHHQVPVMHDAAAAATTGSTVAPVAEATEGAESRLHGRATPPMSDCAALGSNCTMCVADAACGYCNTNATCPRADGVGCGVCMAGIAEGPSSTRYARRSVVAAGWPQWGCAASGHPMMIWARGCRR